MPVVTFSRPDLCRLVGRDVPMEELTERMPMMGGDLDRVEGEEITIEWFPDRPDLLTPEGTGRALRAFLGVAPGMPTYEVQRPRTELRVDPSVAAVRPHAALCFVRNVPLDDDSVQAVVDAQEKLTLAPGRKRRKIAIGVHDAAGLEGPFTYTCVGPDEKPFVPLAWEGGPLTPAEVMEKHPKGREYGHLLPEGRYPVFLDGAGEVLSLPPVINAARTTVTAATRDLLLDVTGTDAASVRRTIALLATGFAERGGTIEAVTVHDESGAWTSPDLRPTERVLETEEAVRLLGKDLSGAEVAAALERMGHRAEDYENRVLVQTPAWRYDILHPIDLVEDVAIGHGFENFAGEQPRVLTWGTPLPAQAVEARARTALLGHGWSEARTLTLSSAEEQWTKWGAGPAAAVTVRNPVLEDRTLLRQRIVPGLLQVLAANRHRPLPQRIFEVGQVVVQDGGAWRNRLHVGAVEQAAKTGFSDVKALVESLVRDLRLDAMLEPAEPAGFIAGRAGRIAVDGREVGHFGELHPDTIVAFGLGAATVALELDLS